MKCYYHPDREAVAVCSRCRKPLCEECTKEYKGKIYCKDCLEEIKKEEALKEKEEEEIRNRSKIILTAILIVIGIIALLPLLWLAATHKVTRFSVPDTGRNVVALYNGEHTLHLQIDVDNASIKIIKGAESDKVLYTVHSENIVTNVDYDKKSSTLRIESNVTPVDKNGAIKVYISPLVSNVSFSIEDMGGDVKIDGLDGFNSPYANITVGKGDIQLSNAVFGNLKIANGTGDTSIESCTIEKDGCSIINGTGDVKFINTDVIGGETNVELETGNFIINGVKYFKSLSVKQGMGDCKIDLSNVTPSVKEGWKIDIKSGAGNIRIETGDLPVKAQIKAFSCKLNGEFLKNGNIYTAGDLSSPNILNISIVSMGSVELVRR